MSARRRRVLSSQNRPAVYPVKLDFASSFGT